MLIVWSLCTLRLLCMYKQQDLFDYERHRCIEHKATEIERGTDNITLLHIKVYPEGDLGARSPPGVRLYRSGVRRGDFVGRCLFYRYSWHSCFMETV